MATSGGERLKILSNKSGLETKPQNNWSPTLFSPTFQYFYTDISAISVTFRNSAILPPDLWSGKERKFIFKSVSKYPRDIFFRDKKRAPDLIMTLILIILKYEIWRVSSLCGRLSDVRKVPGGEKQAKKRNSQQK